MIICHCFQYTVRDIQSDYAIHKRSTLLAKILESKKNGECECATKNPSGT